MFSDRRKKAIVLSAVASVMALALLVWHLASAPSREARADDSKLRDLPDSLESGSTNQSAPIHPALASIPWKRDSDRFAPAVVASAQLPWLRRADHPDSVSMVTAQLPWMRTAPSEAISKAISSELPHALGVETAALPWDEQRLTSYAPVFLETGQLPWRY